MEMVKESYHHQEWGVDIVELEPSESNHPVYTLDSRTGILYIAPPRLAENTDDSKLAAKVTG